MVIAHHHHHAIAHQVGAELLGAALQRGGELRRFGRAQEAAAEEVAEHHVLGEDPAAVGGLPPERRAIDRGGHATPDHRTVQTAHPQDLRHLADVAELVGHVTDVECAVTGEFACAGEPHLQVADV